MTTQEIEQAWERRTLVEYVNGAIWVLEALGGLHPLTGEALRPGIRHEVQRTINHLPARTTQAKKADALSNAYPFDSRDGDEYEMWCQECDRALGW